MSSSESSRSTEELAGLLQTVCREINETVAAGRAPDISAQSVQELLAAAIRLYATAQVEGSSYAALENADVVTQTEVAVTVSGLLSATRLELFEVAMWQVLGRP